MGLEAHLATAQAIVREQLVWDNHSCMPLRPDDHSFLAELEAVRDSGVDMLSLNIGFGEQSPEEHLAMLDSFRRWIADHGDRYQMIQHLSDIDEARASSRLGLLFDVEGMFPLNGGRIDLVERLRDGGVGWMLIAYNNPTDAGSGCLGEDRGLTAYGRQVLAEMKRVGMIVCCSHTGHRTALEVMEHADNPVIFSHSNASALFEHHRNIPDTLIRACAATGGVVGINGLGHFLGADEGLPARVAQHVDHVVQLVGPKHAALGLDYVYDQQELLAFLRSKPATFPDDLVEVDSIPMVHPSAIVDIVVELLAKGYSVEALAAILGGNWRRVASKVWH